MTSGLRSQELFSPLEIQTGIMDCIRELNELHQKLDVTSRKSVEMDRDYRVAQAKAYLQPTEGTQEARKAHAALRTADAQFVAHLAKSDRENALEKIKSLREELKAWNGLAFLCRSEMRLAGTEGF